MPSRRHILIEIDEPVTETEVKLIFLEITDAAANIISDKYDKSMSARLITLNGELPESG